MRKVIFTYPPVRKNNSVPLPLDGIVDKFVKALYELFWKSIDETNTSRETILKDGKFTKFGGLIFVFYCIAISIKLEKCRRDYIIERFLERYDL